MEIKEELINEVISKDSIAFENLDDYWVITVNGKLFTPSFGTCFFKSRQEAWKRWYQQTHYKVKHKYKNEIAIKNGVKYYWECDKTLLPKDREIWEAFKAQLFENTNFKIIQWKYAKRDVCGESRA